MENKFAKLDEEMAKRSELDKALGVTTAEGFAEWLIVAHGTHESSRKTIVLNLEGALRAERIKGSLIPARIDISVKLFGFTILHIKSNDAR